MKVTEALAIFGTCIFISLTSVSAEDVAPPKATATRPAKEPVGQTSMPNNVPSATTTQPTGSYDQEPVTKRMNEDEKKKVETEGK